MRNISVHMTSIGKENRSSQCLSYKEQYVRKGGRGGGGGAQSEGRGVVLVYKIGLKCRQRERERVGWVWRKICSLFTNASARTHMHLSLKMCSIGCFVF